MYDSYSCTKFLLSLLLYVGELDRWLVAVFYFFFFFISFLAVSIQILKFCLWSNCFLTWIHTLIIVAQNILYYLTNPNSLMIMTTKLISMKSSSYFFFLGKVVILLAYGLITWKVETKSFSKWANNYFYYSLTLSFLFSFWHQKDGKGGIEKHKQSSKNLGHHNINIRCIRSDSLQRPSNSHCSNIIGFTKSTSKLSKIKLGNWWTSTHSWIYFGSTMVHCSGEFIFTIT